MSPPPTDYTQMSKGSIIYSFSLITSLFFLWGLSYGLLDVLNQHFLTIFELTKTQTTLLQFAYFVAYLVVAPPAGILMRKYGYKKGIHAGLTCYSIGAVMFWPSAKFGKYGMFVAFTFVSAAGLATLEAAANSYITVLGDPRHAAFRLTLAQGFNGIATVVGPIIAAHTFFNGENAHSLGTVQYVYLAMSMVGVVINVGMAFATLPEIQQVTVADAKDVNNVKGFMKKCHTLFGFAAEFAYVGAQVAVASFAIFYITEQPGISPAISTSTASSMFSGCQAVFTVGRFIGVLYLRHVDPAFALFCNGIGLIIFTVLTSVLPGKAGIACLFMIFFFESICYPVIFSVATADLGGYAKIGGGLIAAGVSGGAAWPSMQGAVADRASTHISYLIPLLGFIPLFAYGGIMWLVRCRRYNGSLTIWQMNTLLATDVAVESGSAPAAMESEVKMEEEYLEHAELQKI